MSERTAPGLPLSTWAIDDEVVRLRIRDTDLIHLLPSPESEAAEEGSVIGTSPECDIRLVDPSGRTSRRHATLVRDRSQWMLRDLESKNGIRLGSSTQRTVLLEPATEVGIGGLTLLCGERALHRAPLVSRAAARHHRGSWRLCGHRSPMLAHGADAAGPRGLARRRGPGGAGSRLSLGKKGRTMIMVDLLLLAPDQEELEAAAGRLPLSQRQLRRLGLLTEPDQ